MLVFLIVFLARLAELFIIADQTAVSVSVCLSVCVLLTRVADIITAAHRDLF